MKPTPQMREMMDENRRTLTHWIRALTRIPARQRTVALVLADVTRWIRAYDRGEANPDEWFDLDTLAYQTACDARAALQAHQDKLWLDELRKMPSWAEFIDHVTALGLDPTLECAMMMMKLRDVARRAA